MKDPGGAPPGYERVAPTGLCVGFNGYCGPGGCTPGYKRAAPTGLCVGFNGYCGPGGCTPGYETAPLRGYVWGLMVIVAPGVAPRLRNGRPYGVIRGAQWFLLPQGCTLHLYDVKG